VKDKTSNPAEASCVIDICSSEVHYFQNRFSGAWFWFYGF